MHALWFKKDLRLHEHQALHEALQQASPLLFLYIFEPSLLRCPDWSLRHGQFVYHSLLALQAQLRPYQAHIHIFYGEALEVFEHLREIHDLRGVFSHQETGNAQSYTRDKQMASYFKKHGIFWKESPSNGVQRGLQNRQTWAAHWETHMQKPCIAPDLALLQAYSLSVPQGLRLPESFQKQLADYPAEFQPAGSHYGQRYLHSFLQRRATAYLRSLSKPEESRYHCSRISPYLTWGNLSSREVYQAYLQAEKHSPYTKDLRQFRSRLQWRCHFIQKFESECRMEFEPLNHSYIQLQQPLRDDYLQAWQEARTGYPLVDACMEAVKATGYLNFRMRAMLVSFLCHLLWQPWQAGMHFLAGTFLDYEIGIHCSQFQMQAGVWGVNTIRIYNPIKQSQENDPQGFFIKKWLPALRQVPVPLLHEPWKMTLLEQKLYQCRLGEDYPYPLVDAPKAAKHASAILWEMRKREETKVENMKILTKHVAPRQ